MYSSFVSTLCAIRYEPCKPGNYRPISLTSVPCKLMERLIRDELVEHMSRNNFFNPFQHGFISGKLCVMQFLEFLYEITEALDQDEDVGF